MSDGLWLGRWPWLDFDVPRWCPEPAEELRVPEGRVPGLIDEAN